ncbi:MAG: Gfo/Idh/MocA family oxidoreductase [Rhodospirillales bacterium]|nr:Gfo/Idh/MocA family oxidoreductase [Rhodospirillales bacterium]
MTAITDVAVIGLGSIGLRHAENIRSNDCRVIGFDPDPDRRAKLDGERCITVESREIALNMASAAVIASPNACHLDDVRAAIAAGCHVLIEKPMAHTLEGVEEMLKAADAVGLTVAFAHNLRFHPVVIMAKDMIEGGELGELKSASFMCSSYLPDWRPEQDHRKNYTADAQTGGVLFDISHEFDLAFNLLGPAEVEKATAGNSGTLGIAAEDSAEVVLKHGRGARSKLHLDYMSKEARRGFEVVGSKGRLKADILNRRLAQFDTGGTQTDEQTFGGDIAETYKLEMMNFLNAIENKTRLSCGGHEGLEVLRLVLAARHLSGLPAA